MRGSKGFTLTELMISVAILGILTAVAVPQYQNYIKTGRQVEAKTNLTTIRLLEEQYYADSGSYVAAADTAAIMAAFSGFQPGSPASLSYDYQIVTPTATTFLAKATIKNGSDYFTIDHNNNKLDQAGNSW